MVRSVAVLFAVLLMLLWAVHGSVSEQRHAAAMVAADAPFGGDAAPAAVGVGAVGVAAVFVRALTGHPSGLDASRWLGPGMSVEEFRALYEADPGEGAGFIFTRRAIDH